MAEAEHKNPDQVHILKSIKDTALPLKIVLMRRHFEINELIKLNPGSVLMFDQPSSAPANLTVNDKVIGNGTVVEVKERYGLKIENLL